MRVKSRGVAFKFEGLMIPASSADEFVEVPKELEQALLRHCRMTTVGSNLIIAAEESKAAKPKKLASALKESPKKSSKE
jgi:hypothetical protein